MIEKVESSTEIRKSIQRINELTGNIKEDVNHNNDGD